jgi:hypothetical protein
MRPVLLGRATVVVAIMCLALASGVAAAPRGSGYRDIQSFANVWYLQSLDACTEARLTAQFAGGDNLQDPLGSGKPGSWGDIGLELGVWSTCNGELLASFQGMGFHPDEVVLFDSALVTGVETDLFDSEGNGVHANVDIYWEAVGSPELTTGQHDGYIRVERAAPAVVTGQIVIGAHALWGDSLTFEFDEDDGANIGWAAEIDTMAPPPCVTRVSGLTGWWPGDGTTADVIGGSDATALNGARFGSGMVRAAFALDGVDDYLVVDDSAATDVDTGDFTVSLWARFATTDGEQVLVEKWWQGWDQPSEGWTLTKLDTNAILLAVSGPDLGATGEAQAVTDPGAIEAGRWYHIAARRDGGDIAVFVDGEMRAVGSLDPPFDWDLSSPNLLTFGHRAEGEYFLHGAIDEVQLSVGTAVSDWDIWSAYMAGASGTCPR